MPQDPWFWALLGPIVAAYWLCPRSARPALLAVVSVAWIVWLSPLAAMWVWCASMAVYVGAARGGRWWFVALLVALAAQLLAFKVAAGAGGVAVPLGLSYATFKLIHYAVERRRGGLSQPDLATFLSWMFLFPTFTAGPIERLDHFLAGRSDPLAPSQIVDGLTRIVHGLVKRFVFVELLVAGRRGPAGFLQALPTLDGSEVAAWLFGAFLITWLEFSAYSDLAIGASRLFGLTIEENFDWPIAARNLGDYWRRNHRTLSRWCQVHVHQPMLGLTRAPIVATFATFLVMGLWHGVAWQWLAWGCWHATGVTAWAIWTRTRRRRRWLWADHQVLRPFAHVLTLGWVSAAHAFLAAGEAGEPWDAIRILARVGGVDLAPAALP